MLTQKHTSLKIKIIENVIPILCWSETATSGINKELWWIKKIKVSMFTKTIKSMIVNTFGANLLDGTNKLLNSLMLHWVLTEEVLFLFQILLLIWIMIVLLNQVQLELKDKERDKTQKKWQFQLAEAEVDQLRMQSAAQLCLSNRWFHHKRRKLC